MNFVLDDKIEALKRAGYEVRTEEALVLERDGSESPHRVYNVYENNVLCCAWGAAGTYRVDWMFSRELEKRMLKLF